MTNIASNLYVRYHDQKLQQAARLRRVHEDQEGLSLVAYALGAAFIVVPLGVALYLFGQDAAQSANDGLAEITTESGGGA